MNILNEIQKKTICGMGVSDQMIQYTKEHAESDCIVKYSETQIKSEFPTFKKIVNESFDILIDFCKKNNLEFTPNHIYPLRIEWSYDLPKNVDGHYFEKVNMIRIYKFYKKETETIEQARDGFKDLDSIKHAVIHEMLHMLFTNVTSKTENGTEILLTSNTGVCDTIDYQNKKEENFKNRDDDEFYTEILTRVILGVPIKGYTPEQIEDRKIKFFNRLKNHEQKQ